MNLKILVISCALTASLIGPAAAPAKEPETGTASAFPLRPRYLDVPVVSTDELQKRFNDVVIVDVRSQYEYDTLHIQGALLLPVTDKNFVGEVRKLREQSPKTLVFYCNGKTCHKSYDAVLMTQTSRIPNAVCYDAGVFDWARAHPDRTVLLGKNPIGPNDLIDDERLKARLLSPKDFMAKAEAGSIILDVRDRAQRDTALFPFKEQRAQLDETAKIDFVIEQARKEDKTLLVYDAVGKQVQWIQYRLEAKGLKNYYFMNGGAQAFWDTTLGKISLGSASATH